MEEKRRLKRLYHLVDRDPRYDGIGHLQTEAVKQCISEGKKLSYEQHPELREKLSEMNKERYSNPEYRSKHSEIMKIALNTEEARRNNSDSAKRRWSDQEARKRMSKSVKKAIAESDRTRKEKEVDQALSDRRKQEFTDRPELKQHAIQVCLDNAKKLSNPIYGDGQVYESQTAAAKALGVHRSSIQGRIKSPHFPEWYEIDRATYEQMAASA